jgi:glycosyltransferase involved in cell wall biosynthesis
VRILVVGQTIPWPPISGARIRLGHVVAALATLGDVDLFAVTDRDAGPVPPSPLDRVRVEVVRAQAASLSWPRRLRWALAADRPLALAARDWHPARRRLAAWARPAYDLIWCHRTESYALVRGLAAGPTIVDLDDLEDRKAAGRAALEAASRRGAWRQLRRWLSAQQAKRDVAAWTRWQTRVASAVQAVTVCSESDRRHLGAPNATVIPNGYDDPSPPAGRDRVGTPPTVMLAGFLPYAPNLDAARWLVREIAPRIWRRMPEVQIRLVGEATDEIRGWHHPPEIVVTGVVSEIAVELAGADLVAVPIRFGGGTRIKILEAFAHRIPVVSTPAGATGLDVAHERELLLAGDAEAFAEACGRLLTDTSLRRRLTAAAHRLFQARYRWEDIHEAIVAVARRTAVTARGEDSRV